MFNSGVMLVIVKDTRSEQGSFCPKFKIAIINWSVLTQATMLWQMFKDDTTLQLLYAFVSAIQHFLS